MKYAGSYVFAGVFLLMKGVPLVPGLSLGRAISSPVTGPAQSPVQCAAGEGGGRGHLPPRKGGIPPPLTRTGERALLCRRR